MLIQSLRFLIVGLVNTLIGVGLIFLLMSVGLSDVVANLSGFSVGLMVSYNLNGRWTFQSKRLDGRAIGRFIVIVVIAYLANLFTLLVSRDLLSLNPYVSQLAGILVYAMLSFIGFRMFVFKV
jgi:putative flippase GtrA